MWSEIITLFETLHDYEGRHVFRDVLQPATRSLSTFAETFARYMSLTTSPAGADVSDEDLCIFYALSRVSDVLILGLQPPPVVGSDHPQNDWSGPGANSTEVLGFFCALGLDPVEQAEFSPFYHEMVEIIEDPTCERPVIEDVLWPGLRFGHMLFSRAGVRVRCRRAMFDPDFATRSTLYFSFRRRYRPTCDLSHGWGYNSQWRTSFRRDYAEGQTLSYNVDGRRSLNDFYIKHRRDDDLTKAERSSYLPIDASFVRLKMTVIVGRLMIATTSYVAALESAPAWSAPGAPRRWKRAA